MDATVRSNVKLQQEKPEENPGHKILTLVFSIYLFTLGKVQQDTNQSTTWTIEFKIPDYVLRM